MPLFFMKYSFFIFGATLILCGSCESENTAKIQSHPGFKTIRISEHVVNIDSIKPAIPISIDSAAIGQFKIGPPKSFEISSPEVRLQKPVKIEAGIPTKLFPGKDSLKLPVQTKANGKKVSVGPVHTNPVTAPDFEVDAAYWFHLYGAKNGLVKSTVMDLFNDSRGNMWICTQGSGVIQFDGTSATKYNYRSGMPMDVVTCGMEDSKGILWFGTNGGGLVRYDGFEFTIFGSDEGLDNQIISIVEDRAGNYWICSYDHGIFRYEPDSTFTGGFFTQYTTEQGLEMNQTYDLHIDSQDNVYINNFQSGFSILHRPENDGPEYFEHYTIQEGLSAKEISYMFLDPDDRLYIMLGFNEINIFDGSHITLMHLQDTTEAVQFIAGGMDDNGTLWLGTYQNGLYKHKPGTDFMIRYSAPTSAPIKTSGAFLVDNSNHVWLNSAAGLLRFAGDDFRSFTKTEGLLPGIVNSMTSDGSGRLWMGIELMGLAGLDGNILSLYDAEAGLKAEIVSVRGDRNDQLWISSYGGGLMQFIPNKNDAGATLMQYNSQSGFTSDYLLSSMEDSQQRIWATSNGGGITILETERNKLTNLTISEGISNNQVYNVVEDKKGNFWMGTHGGGLNRVTPSGEKMNGQVSHITKAEGATNDAVIHTFADHAGNIWMGIPGGVDLYLPDDTGRAGYLTNFTEREGFWGGTVFDIWQDQDFNTYFGTSNGINILRLDQYDKLLPKLREGNVRDDDQFFEHYGDLEGYPGGALRNTKHIDRNRITWLGGRDRVLNFDAKDLKDYKERPNAEIRGITVFNEEIDWNTLIENPDSTLMLANGIAVHDVQSQGSLKWYTIPDQLSLPYNNNQLTFHFAAIAQRHPQYLRFQYKLEGLDQNWSGLSIRKEAPYGNLPFGDYTFRLKALSNSGVWSDEVTYSFAIRPPWWFTWWAYVIYALLLLVLAWRVHIILKLRTQRTEREEAQIRELEQAKEIEKAYTELNKAHHNLKSTQAQLIQSEKMASLGELTAGIAHEIQNPLNFVNNFSEVSTELLDEATEELAKVVQTQHAAFPKHAASPGQAASPEHRAAISEALTILDDVKQNLEKITHHGKRADAIVKGMLAHSRAGKGEKAPTDLNALADEYLRLSYHGFRSKDKSFNADFKTDFDPNLPKVNVVPQDIGRVLLNILNNAFYAASLAHHIESDNANLSASAVQTRHAPSLPRPMVIISTKNLGDKIQISISDNGPGIPDSIKDKIFQPFFTTKPTGQGTGLGLSLSYDIVKAHGGELQAESEEGKGSRFYITLPLQ